MKLWSGTEGSHMRDDDEILLPNFSPAQRAEAGPFAADEDAFDRLMTLFEYVHGHGPLSDLEAFEWGATNTDANLTALGFEGRAGFQYNYDCCMAVVMALAATKTKH
jgi:6-phosphofructokinase